MQFRSRHLDSSKDGLAQGKVLNIDHGPKIGFDMNNSQNNANSSIITQMNLKPTPSQEYSGVNMENANGKKKNKKRA